MKPYLDHDDDHFEIGFEQLRLGPGLELAVRDASDTMLDHKAQFVMSFPGKGVLISIRVLDPAKIAMQAGEIYHVSGFTGRFDFSFAAEAVKVDRSLFTVMLTMPAKVSLRFVRKHQRTSLAVPGNVLLAGEKTPVPVTIKNLSLGGASLDSVKPLGAKGDAVTVLLEVTFEGQKENLNLAAVIRRSSESDESLMYSNGVEFLNASRTDKLLLHYYITSTANDLSLI